jgi:hypothetical protein
MKKIWKKCFRQKNQLFLKFVTQSRTGLQIYEGHDDQLNRSGPMAYRDFRITRQNIAFFDFFFF